MRRYTKFWVALSGFAAVLGKTTADGDLTGADLQELAIALVVAIGVWAFPNRQNV